MTAADPERFEGRNFQFRRPFEMRGIRKAFGATVALDGVDLTVRPARICALRRPRTAPAKHADSDPRRLARRRRRLDDDRRPAMRAAKPADARRAGVAMIYQELSLAPTSR
jgi:ribose transport system ATP-binding protein